MKRNVALYRKTKSKPVPVDKFGKCPKCRAEKSKIFWGWDEMYYDLICENGHYWSYDFKKVKGR
jgi:hypothetical protein